jgi:hypothetical protein
MKGTERVRRCHKCRLNVYRVSDLTREKAEWVIGECERRACPSLYRRQDGTVLVQDCPKGVAAARKASRWWKERMFHLFLLVLPWMILCSYIYLDMDHPNYGYYGNSIWDVEPFRTLDNLFSSSPTPGPTMATPAVAFPVGMGGGGIMIDADPGGPGDLGPNDPKDPEVLPPRPGIPVPPGQNPPP